MATENGTDARAARLATLRRAYDDPTRASVYYGQTDRAASGLREWELDEYNGLVVSLLEAYWALADWAKDRMEAGDEDEDEDEV